MEEQRQSIYKISRTIKRRESSLYNALRSIYDDSIFVGEISQLWPELPLIANLRCGLWYSPNFHSNCYFKSTDGHTNNLSFSTSRLNLHVALLAGQRGGCMIVDATRKGKRFPDSMSKTIPIWTCVLNRAIFNHRAKVACNYSTGNESATSIVHDNPEQLCSDWDCSLHLPLWVSETEKAMIEKRLEGWTKELEASGADIASISLSLRKPLRPLWISQKTVIWLNEVPEHDSWNFTPIILVSASSHGAFLHRMTSEFSWNYIAGAGDDEESWARGLSPNLFWKHAHDIIALGPDLCNQNIANIVEKDRVARAQRGEKNTQQVSVKPSKSLKSSSLFSMGEPLGLENGSVVVCERTCDDQCISFLGSTNIAVGKSELAIEVPRAYCILNCSKETMSVPQDNLETYLHLPIVDSKIDRFSLLRNLPSALNFAKTQLGKGKTLLVCCSDGEDISICISLAILTSFYDEAGHFDEGKSFGETRITKLELRRRLVFICKYAVNARPSRGNLKQVFACVGGGSNLSVNAL